MNTRRLLTLILALALTVSLPAFTAFAAAEPEPPAEEETVLMTNAQIAAAYIASSDRDIIPDRLPYVGYFADGLRIPQYYDGNAEAVTGYLEERFFSAFYELGILLGTPIEDIVVDGESIIALTEADVAENFEAVVAEYFAGLPDGAHTMTVLLSGGDSIDYTLTVEGGQLQAIEYAASDIVRDYIVDMAVSGDPAGTLDGQKLNTYALLSLLYYDGSYTLEEDSEIPDGAYTLEIRSFQTLRYVDVVVEGGVITLAE